MTHRPPPHGAAGVAGGSLGGMLPNPSAGSPSSTGYHLADDFNRPPNGVLYGDLQWEALSIGSAPTVSQQTPGTALEVGVARMATNAAGAVDEGGMLGWAVASGRQLSTTPQVGAFYVAKLRMETSTQVRAFSGLLQNQAAWWTGNNDVVGFRASAAGAAANWFGVVRVVAAETTVDLGVLADGTWRAFKWARVIDSSGNNGIQFYVGTQPAVPHNYEYPVIWTATGSIVTTIPSANALTYCPLGVVSQANTTSKSADIDFLDFGGPCRRVG